MSLTLKTSERGGILTIQRHYGRNESFAIDVQQGFTWFVKPQHTTGNSPCLVQLRRVRTLVSSCTNINVTRTPQLGKRTTGTEPRSQGDHTSAAPVPTDTFTRTHALGVISIKKPGRRLSRQEATYRVFQVDGALEFTQELDDVHVPAGG